MTLRTEYFKAMFAQNPELIWVVASSTFVFIGIFLGYLVLRPSSRDAYAAQLALFDDQSI